jgi:hypothetical protein
VICPCCATHMRPLFQSFFCPNECDLPPERRTRKEPEAGKAGQLCLVPFAWDSADLVPGYERLFNVIWGTDPKTHLWGTFDVLWEAEVLEVISPGDGKTGAARCRLVRRIR